MPGPNRRCAFSAYDSTGIEFINFSLNNYFFGQAEGLLISGSKNIVSHMNIKGSGDALNLRGSVYLTDSTIIGDGDTILGRWPRLLPPLRDPVYRALHVDSQHRSEPRQCLRRLHLYRHRPPAAVEPAPGARSALPQCSRACPTITASTTPTPRPCSSTAASKAFQPAGWGPIDDDTSHIHFWEFHSTDADGHPIDVTERHPVSKQLTEPRDAQTIANYSDPAFVLGGWTPVVDQ